MCCYYSLAKPQLIYGSTKSIFCNDSDTTKIFADAEAALQENFNLTSTADLEDELCKDLLPPKNAALFCSLAFGLALTLSGL